MGLAALEPSPASLSVVIKPTYKIDPRVAIMKCPAQCPSMQPCTVLPGCPPSSLTIFFHQSCPLPTAVPSLPGLQPLAFHAVLPPKCYFYVTFVTLCDWIRLILIVGAVGNLYESVLEANFLPFVPGFGLILAEFTPNSMLKGHSWQCLENYMRC